MSVRGSLSTLDLSVDLPQYKLVRGLLVHNLGEPVGMEPTDLIQPHHVPVRGREGEECCFVIGLCITFCDLLKANVIPSRC